MNEKEKTTVPIPPVGADGEQSLSYVSNEIITAETEEINPIDESMEEMLRQMQRMSDPSYLAMVRHEWYAKYKTAPTLEEREAARQRYLDERGVPQSFRWTTSPWER